MTEKSSFFASLLDWLADADRRGEPFPFWPEASKKIRGWDVLVNLVLKRRALADFDVESADDIKGVDLFSIAVDPDSRRQGRAIATIRHLLDNVRRAESLDYFAVTEVENEDLRAGLRKHVPELIEADEGRFFYFIKPSVSPLPERARKKAAPLRREGIVPKKLSFEGV